VLHIGLTGGVASGKSTVAALFAARGAPVIDTDRLAREAVVPGSPTLAAVLAAFGADFALPDGSLDRRRLRELVFAEPARRRQLEAILHPAIRAAQERELGSLAAPYALIAVPLLTETGQRSRFDRVLVVDCPPELQKSRLIERDHETPERAEAMLAAQASRAERLAIADDVIENVGTRAELERAVDQLHHEYLLRAGAPRPTGVAR
jgi:dephospho-CoA kinase